MAYRSSLPDSAASQRALRRSHRLRVLARLLPLIGILLAAGLALLLARAPYMTGSTAGTVLSDEQAEAQMATQGTVVTEPGEDTVDLQVDANGEPRDLRVRRDDQGLVVEEYPEGVKPLAPPDRIVPVDTPEAPVSDAESVTEPAASAD